MRFLLPLLAVLALSACSQSKNSSAEEATEAFRSYVTALNDGDIDFAAAMYDDNEGFHWIERGQVQYDAGTQAAASLRELSQSGGDARMTVDELKATAMGDDGALISAHFDYAMFDAAGKQQFSFDGWMTVGMARRAEGWKIVGGQTGPGKADE